MHVWMATTAELPTLKANVVGAAPADDPSVRHSSCTTAVGTSVSGHKSYDLSVVNAAFLTIEPRAVAHLLSTTWTSPSTFTAPIEATSHQSGTQPFTVWPTAELPTMKDKRHRARAPARGTEQTYNIFSIPREVSARDIYTTSHTLRA